MAICIKPLTLSLLSLATNLAICSSSYLQDGSMREEPSVTSPAPPLPIVDISEQKLARKAREAHREGDAKLNKKYKRFLKTIRRRHFTDFDRIQSHYQKKMKKLQGDLRVLDWKLTAIKDKKRVFEAFARRLSEFPPNHLAKAALDVAKTRSDLVYFNRYFANVEMVQEEIEKYLDEKMNGGERKRIESTWHDEYLYILRNKALELVSTSPERFDLIRKYDTLDKLQSKLDRGEGNTSKERIDYKREKADTLLNALLYNIPESASTLASLREQKIPRVLDAKDRVEEKIAKTRAKASAWSLVDRRGF